MRTSFACVDDVRYVRHDRLKGDGMTIAWVREFLLSNLLFNYAILLLWFGVFRWRHDWLLGLHRRWFRLSQAQFDAIHYAAMAVYKIGVLLFNLVPLLALWLIG